MHPTESSALNDSDLLSGWLSYVRTDYRDSLSNESHQPTISIPQHWGYPRFALEQRTNQGIILGLQYYPSGTELAEQFDAGWRYAVMPNRNSDELFHFQENQIQPLSPEELLSEITAEIKFYQQQITILQQQLAVVTGGSVNA